MRALQRSMKSSPYLNLLVVRPDPLALGDLRAQPRAAPSREYTPHRWRCCPFSRGRGRSRPRPLRLYPGDCFRSGTRRGASAASADRTSTVRSLAGRRSNPTRSSLNPQRFLRRRGQRAIIGDLDRQPPEELQQAAQREVHNDLMMLQPLATLHRAEVPQEAIMAVAHASEPAISELAEHVSK